MDEKLEVKMSVVDAARFGAMLRESRRSLGLSQAELGAGRYSGSYISHLESGRRVATPEVIEFLSRRLGVSPLEWGVSPEGEAQGGPAAGTIEDLLVAERAWSDRDWGSAAEHAAQAAATALAAGDIGRHWEALYVLAQSRFSSGEFAEAARLAQELSEHETARQFAVARAQALSLASVSYRAADRLGWAVAFGARAVEAASTAPAIILAEALMALVSAMFEAGHPPEESRPYLDRLAVLSPRLTSDHSRGMIAWTVGTAAFMGNDVDGGLRSYAEAGELLDPRRDIRLWLRYKRSAARVRLDAGIVEGVPELVEAAATGLRIVGNNHDLVELRQVEAKLELMRGNAENAARIMSELLTDPVLGSSEYSRGGSEFIFGEALEALGDERGAAERFEAAARRYEEEGRLRAAVDAWRRSARHLFSAKKDDSSDISVDNDLTGLVKSV